MDAVGEDATDEVVSVIRREHTRLVRAVTLSCGSLPEAEDAVQEAFARAWERAARGETFTHLAGWVVTVALNLTRSGRRRERRNTDWPGELGVADDRLAPELIDLRDAVGALPRRQREVVVLHYYLGYPVAQIASLLSVSDGNVKNALFRARASLAEALRVDEEVSE